MNMNSMNRRRFAALEWIATRPAKLGRLLATAGAVTLPFNAVLAGGLAGSHASMVHQHAIAVKNDFSFTRTPAQVKSLVADGALVKVSSTHDVTLAGVSYPYTRPDVLAFITNLAAQYHAALGSPLVVTSLVRPESRQPSNASPLSVHPAGMAVDFRIPKDTHALSWLESKLLSLENAGVLDVTREHRPPHLHVAVFPDAYRAYAAKHPSAVAAPATPKPTPLAPAAADNAASVSESETSHGGFPVEFAIGVLGAGAIAAGLFLLMLRVERRISHEISA
jgi:hypothetical protein